MKVFIPAIIWALVIFILSILPGANLPETMQSLLSFDKVSHALAYGVLTGLLGWGLARRPSFRTSQLWIAAGISIFYGIVMEGLQYSFFPYRYFELYDIIANIIGSLVSLFVMYFFIK